MIYKYRSFESKYRYDIFTNSEVYFAKPSEFNDPFESKPQLVGLETLKKRQDYVENYIKRKFDHLKYIEKRNLKKELLIRFVNSNSVAKDIHKVLNEYGIFSAAEKWDQALMWSHYSNSHKGFCVGFEFEKEFDFEMGMALEVKYKTNYPNLSPEIFIENTIENNEKILEATLATKSKEWSYENEIRYIKLARDGGNGVYEFSSSNVKEVIFGACITKDNKDELIRIVKKHMPWVNFYQSRTSKSKYELYREPLKLTNSSSGTTNP